MSVDGKQAAGDAGTGAGADAKVETEQPKALDAAESAKVLKALADRNAENKAQREAREAAETRAKTLELELAKARGDVEATRRLEAEQRAAEIKAREDRIAELAPKAEQAARLEAALKAHVEATTAKLSDSDKALVASLPLEQQAAFAARLAGTAAPAAPATKPGAPGRTETTKSFAAMSPEEQSAFLAENRHLSPAELKEKLGMKSGRGIFS